MTAKHTGEPPETGATDEPAPPTSARPSRVTKRVVARAATGAATVAHAVAGAAGVVADAADSRRRVRPLPNLYDLHREARNASVRELGLTSIPVDEIIGTAVEGIAQRGTDFKPLPAFRSRNWDARWQRIVKAVREMRSLPPIDVLKTQDGYWVTDGHNRVAAAIEVGQVEVDADVRAVLLPGEPVPRPSGSLASVLQDSAQVEAAGRGRLTRGTTIGSPVPDHDHDHGQGGGDKGDRGGESGPTT